MTRCIVAVCVIVGAWCADTSAQLPVPSALLESRVVYLTGQVPEREWLDWAAEEIRKLGRFQLVAERESAELVISIISSTRQEGAAAIPIDGVGIIAVPLEGNSVRIVVQREIDNRELWRDQREINWLASGAVKDLIRDLHKAIDRNSSLVRTSDTEQITTEPIDVFWGLEPCSRWQNARAGGSVDSTAVVNLIVSWANGFVFTFFIKDNAPPSDAFKPLAAAAWLDTFCQADPDMPIIGAAGAFANELIERSQAKE